MSQKFLDGAHIIAAFQQMRGKAMGKGMTTGRFGNAGRADGELHGILQVLFRNVMTPFLAGTRVQGWLI
jgi:hypothetical protein